MKPLSHVDDKSQHTQHKEILHIIWGVALFLMGVGLFFRIPQLMPKIETIDQFSSILSFIKFCFYLIGILLVWGGIKKIYSNHRMLSEKNHNANKRQ